MNGADVHGRAAQRRRRILPFRGLAEDAAFVWRMCNVRYEGRLDDPHVQEDLERNLAASRAHRFPLAIEERDE